jgi:hypothetical protein
MPRICCGNTNSHEIPAVVTSATPARLKQWREDEPSWSAVRGSHEAELYLEVQLRQIVRSPCRALDHLPQ